MQFIIFDLEATCFEHGQQNHEIIEIGAVKCDAQANPAASFQTYVKPTKNPVLSQFCKDLTSISQENVSSAPYFAEAMLAFEEFILDSFSPQETFLLSWGHYDKNQIETESVQKNYNGRILDLLKNHHSLKHEYAKLTAQKPCGMKGALLQLGIPLDGTHHRGIDDATNIMKIFQKIYSDWSEKFL